MFEKISRIRVEERLKEGLACQRIARERPARRTGRHFQREVAVTIWVSLAVLFLVLVGGCVAANAQGYLGTRACLSSPAVNVSSATEIGLLAPAFNAQIQALFDIGG